MIRDRPESSRTDLLIGCVIAVFAAVSALPLMRIASAMDEGIVLQGGIRILHGQVPYRDFFSFYTPLSYYVAAAAFRVFGETLVGARVVLLIYSALMSLIVYLLARRITNRPASSAIAVVFALIAVPSVFALIHNWDSSVFALLALYFLVLFIESPQWWWIALTGLCTGLTGMANQAKGGGLLLGFGLAALLLRLSGRALVRRAELAIFIVSALLPALGFSLYFWRNGALGQMIDGWFWAFKHYSAANKVPYGFVYWNEALRSSFHSLTSLEQLVFSALFLAAVWLSALPLFSLGLFIATCHRTWKQRSTLTYAQSIFVVEISVLAGLLIGTVFTGRSDYIHLVFLLPFSFIALPFFWQEEFVPLAGVRRIATWVAIFGLPCLVLHAMVLRAETSTRTHVESRRGKVKFEMPELLAYVDAHVPEGSKVQVYPYSPLLQFLTGTYSPSRYEYLQAGMHSAEDYAIALAEFERDKTPVVLYDMMFASNIGTIWPSTPASALAHDPFERFILDHYKPCRVFAYPRGRFVYMVRKDLGCPKD